MAKLISAQNSYTLLIANINGAGDPSKGSNPVKMRQVYHQQFFPEIGRALGEASKVTSPSTPGLATRQGLVRYTTVPIPSSCIGAVTVVSNDFTDKATLYVGSYTVTSDVDFTPGGTTALTATALAAAIDALPQFSASAVANVVTVEGPFGLEGNLEKFDASYKGSIVNYSLDPDDGFFAQAEPDIGPPELG